MARAKQDPDSAEIQSSRSRKREPESVSRKRDYVVDVDFVEEKIDFSKADVQVVAQGGLDLQDKSKAVALRMQGKVEQTIQLG